MLSMLIFWLANHILNDDMRMVTIISLLEKGVKIEGVENLVTRELEETKSSISKIILAMTEVSNANYKELRREVNYRREVEKELKYEIVVRKEAEEKLKNLAFYDPLTGLANRRLFEELCSAALRAAEREKLMQAILFIDIDGFKSINDTFGHEAGDELLISIARQLEKFLRASDSIARIGGDEFVAHLGGNTEEDDATRIASKLVSEITNPFTLSVGEVNVGASVGVSLYPSDGKSSEMLLRNADAAMYAAKKGGKTLISYFAPWANDAGKNLKNRRRN